VAEDLQVPCRNYMWPGIRPTEILNSLRCSQSHVGNWNNQHRSSKIMQVFGRQSFHETACCLPHLGWVVLEQCCSRLCARRQQRQGPGPRFSESCQETAESPEEIHEGSAESSAQNGEERPEEHALSEKKFLNSKQNVPCRQVSFSTGSIHLRQPHPRRKTRPPVPV